MSKQLVLEPERVRELAPGKLKAAAKTVHTALVTADNPAEIVQIGAALDAIEDMMHAAGLYGLDEIVPVNQDRMFARWKLGRALEKIERSKGGRPGKNSRHHVESFKAFLADLNLDLKAAERAQRIGALPDDERVAQTKPRLVKHVLQVAPSWGTLYQISRLSDQALDRAIKAKIITPTVERAEIARLLSKETRTAQMFMAIARDQRLVKRKSISVLPPHWGTLYKITM
jgi:hypothetical protein